MHAGSPPRTVALTRACYLCVGRDVGHGFGSARAITSTTVHSCRWASPLPHIFPALQFLFPTFSLQELLWGVVVHIWGGGGGGVAFVELSRYAKGPEVIS